MPEPLTFDTTTGEPRPRIQVHGGPTSGLLGLIGGVIIACGIFLLSGLMTPAPALPAKSTSVPVVAVASPAPLAPTATPNPLIPPTIPVVVMVTLTPTPTQAPSPVEARQTEIAQTATAEARPKPCDMTTVEAGERKICFWPTVAAAPTEPAWPTVCVTPMPQLNCTKVG